MPIIIKKQNGDIKFYGKQSDEPISVIYGGDGYALLDYALISDIITAKEVSNAAMIAGLIVECMSIKGNDGDYKTNNIPTIYVPLCSNLLPQETLFSARKVLNWLESDKVVTINKRERIRYKFVEFAYEDEKLVIMYKPVAW